MKLRRVFRIEEHEEFGSIGLRPVSMPHADPIGGMGIAHDILEHFPNDNGGVEAELMALGASIFVRKGSYYYSLRGCGDTNPAEHIASDFMELRRHIDNEGFSLVSTGKGSRALWNFEADQTIRETVERAAKLCRDEEAGVWSEEEKETARRYMRIGWRKAEKRFRHHNRFDLVGIFMQIEQDVDKFLAYSGSDYLGADVVISVDTDKRRVSIELKEEW